MASMYQESSGAYRIQYTCPHTGRRKTIRLGRLDKPTARTIEGRVERLIQFLAVGEQPDPETAQWVRGLSADVSEKLINAGLLGRGGGTPTGLDTFIAYFIKVTGGQRSASTNNHYRQARDRAVTHFGKDRDIRTLTVGEVMAFSGWLRSPEVGLGENTARKRCATLAAMFNFAVACDLLAKNPFADKRVPKSVLPAADDRRYFLSNEDAQKVLRACQTVGGNQLAAMFAAARWGGLRVGEILLLRWEHVNFDLGRLTVLSPKTASKGKDRRIVPLFPEVRRALSALTHESARNPVLPAYSGKTEAWATKMLLAARKEAGVVAWPRPWQNLRETRATELADVFPGHVCDDWLGHTKAVADACYRRPNETHFLTASRLEGAPGARAVWQVDLQAPENQVPDERQGVVQNPVQLPSKQVGNQDSNQGS